MLDLSGRDDTPGGSQFVLDAGARLLFPSQPAREERTPRGGRAQRLPKQAGPTSWPPSNSRSRDGPTTSRVRPGRGSEPARKPARVGPPAESQARSDPAALRAGHGFDAHEAGG